MQRPPKGLNDNEILLIVIINRGVAMLSGKCRYFTRKISKHYDFTGHVSRSLNV